MSKTLSIDIGLRGGLAFWLDDTLKCAMPMPVVKTGNKRTIDFDKLAEVVVNFHPHNIIIENVHAFPRQGVCSVFSFGVQKGFLLGVAATLRAFVVQIDPGTWKRQLGLIGQSKAVSLQLAHINRGIQVLKTRAKINHITLSDRTTIHPYPF